MSRSIYVMPDIAERRGLSSRLAFWRDWVFARLGRRMVDLGVPIAFTGRRYRPTRQADQVASTSRVIHTAARHDGKIAGGFAAAEDMPADPGWWGFAFRDVPERRCAPTLIHTIPEAKVLAIRAGESQDYVPAILSGDVALQMREIRHRPEHSALNRKTPDLQLDDALWIAERVFDNYSHWFSAHLPKLVMLRDQGEMSDLVLPAPRPEWVDASLQRIGIDKGDFHELPVPGVLRARRLRVVESDRFRPELLQAARAATTPPAGKPDRRVFVTRRKARGRMLLEEAELAPLLEAAGFERVAMEALSLGEQIDLMARTETLLAPHGAGLTNMLFCSPGTRICEIADPGYPNPNFYAMASALGHHYHYIGGRGVGEGHPLRQDLSVSISDVRAFLELLA